MSRVGRGRPASSLLRGAGISARAGALTGSAGGSGALSVAPVLNIIDNPTFAGSNSMPGWGTSGFSLVSGATIVPGVGSGEFTFTAVDQGVNYAPPGLATFLAGVRYYAEVKVLVLSGDGATVEIVLGSTSDDYAATQAALTGFAQQTIRVSWVPQADRSAVDHGLAIRVKTLPTVKDVIVDDAIIATADGFWSGWRVGGKGALKTITTSAGGGATLTTGQGTSSTIASSAGGSGTLTGKKGAAQSLITTSGGSAALTLTGAHTKTLAASAGGSGTFATSTSSSTALLPIGGLFGGGGRVGRSHPAIGIVSRGVGATTSLFARSGALAGSAGGTGTLSTAKGGRGQAVSTSGSTGTLTISKGGKGALVASAGGTGTTSGAQTPTTGGIVATFMMGGGGRMGRSHPAIGIVSHGNVLLPAFNTEARSGSLAASGGGGGTFSARKGGVSSTPTSIPAPPPVFVDILTLPGLRSSAGGNFTYSYSRSATQVGSVVGSAGGAGTFTATKKVAGALTASAGGNATLTVRKGGRSAITSSAGGGFTYSYTRFEARNGSLGSSAGGSGTFRGSKQATRGLAAQAGGSITVRAAKGTRGALTSSAGGSFTYSYVVGGLAAIGSLTGSAGGSGRFVTVKGVTAVRISTTAGGNATLTHIKGTSGFVISHAGGTGTFTRRQPTASTQDGRVNPRHRLNGRVSRDELHDLPVLLRR